MKAIIVFVFDHHEISCEEASPRSETETLPNATMTTDRAGACPFWTWFIENPRIEAAREIAA